MSAEPLRHYYVQHERDPERDRCERRGCALPKSDPVHLEPDDTDAFNDAIRAANPHHKPPRIPEDDEHARERARKRNAARWRASAADTSG